MAACRALLIVLLLMLLAACKDEPAAPMGQAPADAGPAVAQLEVHPGQAGVF